MKSVRGIALFGPDFARPELHSKAVYEGRIGSLDERSGREGSIGIPIPH